MKTVSFPNLGLEFTVQSTAFTLFGVSVAWYAVLIAVGFIAAVCYALSQLKRYGLDEDRVMDVIIVGMIAGIIGARAYYVMFSWTQYSINPSEIFNLRSGGLAIYGGLIGALGIGAIVCKIRKVKILPMFDVTAISFLIGQCIGRWGNFVNVEAYGSETDSLFMMMSSSISDSYGVHPCFLYESVWCLIGFVLLHFYAKKRRRFDGEMVLLYCVWYGFERMIVEGLRTDSLYWGPFRVSQLLSAFLCIVALIAWLLIHARIRRENDENFLKLYVHTDASKELLQQGEEKRNRKKKQLATLDEVEAEEAAAKAEESAAESEATEEVAEESEAVEET